MKKHCYTTVIGILFLLILFTGVTFADTESVTDDGLYFALDRDTTFLRYTTGIDSLEVATITFSMTFGINDESIPAGNLTAISFEFTFDPDSLTFIGADPVGPWTVDTTTISDGRVWIQVYGQSVQPPDDDPTAFATMRFYANCQSEKSVDDVEFDRIRCYATVGGTPYAPGPTSEDNWNDGAVCIEDYQMSFSLGSDSVMGGYGQEIILPIYFKSNFSVYYSRQSIVYDTNKFEILGKVKLDSTIGTVAFYPGGSPGLFTFTVIAYDGLGPTFDDSTAFYGLRIKIIDSTEWDGQTAWLVFEADSSFTYPSGDPIACAYALTDDPPIELDSGSVTLERYTAAFNAVPQNDIYYFDDTVALAYNLQLKNSFYVGMPDSTSQYNGNIGFDLTAAGDTEIDSISNIDSDLKFHLATDAPDYAVYQKWDEAKSNAWDPQEDFENAVRIFLTIPEPASYEDRSYTPFSFTDGCGGFNYSSQVTDLYGYITADSTNGRLTWDVQPVTIAMGEFDGSDGSSNQANVTANIRIRHNVPISDFEIELCPGSSFYVYSVTPASGVVIDTVGNSPDSSCRVLSADGNTVWTDTSATGHVIATVSYYLTSDDCDPDTHVYDSVWFSDFYMEDTLGHSLPVVGNTGASLHAICRSTYVDPIQPDLKLVTGLPTSFALHANYPNPFNPSTRIEFDLPSPSHVTLDIFNIVGQRVATLVDRQYSAGYHSVDWNGKSSYGQPVASGVYLYRLTAGDFIATRKMVLLK